MASMVTGRSLSPIGKGIAGSLPAQAGSLTNTPHAVRASDDGSAVDEAMKQFRRYDAWRATNRVGILFAMSHLLQGKNDARSPCFAVKHLQIAANRAGAAAHKAPNLSAPRLVKNLS
jgi:hypothetical protein